MTPLFLALVWTGGCGGVDYRAADLQLDLVGELPEDVASVRICVEGVGARVMGARLAGTYSYPGLPVDAPLDITVNVLDEDGEVLLEAQAPALSGYREEELRECDPCSACQASGTAADPDGPSWLLALRFWDGA